jgi:murein DD-endopeptidase MepM/ murein hydrolase activator NlpD
MVFRVVKVARRYSRESMTVMVVPDRRGSVRSFRISCLFLLLIFASVVITVIGSMVWALCVVNRLQHAHAKLGIQELALIDLKRSRKELEAIIEQQKGQVRDFVQQTYWLQQKLVELEEQTLEIRDVLTERKTESSDNKWISDLKLPEVNPLMTSYLPSGGPDEPFVRASMVDLAADVIARMSLHVPSTFATLEMLRDNVMEYQRIVRHTPSLWPVEGPISSAFGYRTHPTTREWRMHEGVDIVAAHGTPIRAAGTGVVVHAGEKGGYGYSVVIDHEYGLKTLYAHMSKILVKRGGIVEKGECIGFIGSSGVSTGPHLHYEVWQDGKPVSPAYFLD